MRGYMIYIYILWWDICICYILYDIFIMIVVWWDNIYNMYIQEGPPSYKLAYKRIRL